MYSKEDLEVVHIEINSSSLKKRVDYATRVYDDIDVRSTRSLHDFLSLESIDGSLVADSKISEYTSFESVGVSDDGKSKLRVWLEKAINTLIRACRAVYDYIGRCVDKIVSFFKSKRDVKDSSLKLKEIAKKNNMQVSLVDKIDLALSKVKVVEIKPLRIPGSTRTYKLESLKDKVTALYTDSLYLYHTDSQFRTIATDIKNKLSSWVAISAKSTEGFISGLEAISRQEIPKGALIGKIEELSRFAPNDSLLRLNSVMSRYKRTSKRRRVETTHDTMHEALKWINDDIREKTHTRELIAKSPQTLRDIDVSESLLHNETFTNNLESMSKNLKRLTESKMNIFKLSSDFDTNGLRRLLEIDERIRKYVIGVYQAVSTINIIASIEEGNLRLKEAIHNQKMVILSGFKNLEME